jgi:hypothetical protein
MHQVLVAKPEQTHERVETQMGTHHAIVYESQEMVECARICVNKVHFRRSTLLPTPKKCPKLFIACKQAYHACTLMTALLGVLEFEDSDALHCCSLLEIGGCPNMLSQNH